MKAPDVIYLHKIRDEESSGYYSQWFDSRARCVPSEKYIRKEALTEWLKSELENGGPTTLVQHIINRINSL